MARSRSAAYQVLKDRVATDLATPGWTYGRRWAHRVGLVRLTAESVALGATQMLDDINLSTHRNDPELAALLLAAREATAAYATAVARDNWRRFEGRDKP